MMPNPTNEESVTKTARKFDTGATRDTDSGKLKIEGFIDPLVDLRYSQYMHLHRKQSDGQMREPDNWQKGIPRAVYADSLIRHILDFRLHHDGFAFKANDPDIESVLCAIIFNARGYLFEILKQRGIGYQIEENADAKHQG
jgi:hypothetical protein